MSVANYYAVLLGLDSIPDNDFHMVTTTIDSITDTFCTIIGLQSKAWYKVKVLTIGGNLSSNVSWHPLLFQTE